MKPIDKNWSPKAAIFMESTKPDGGGKGEVVVELTKFSSIVPQQEISANQLGNGSITANRKHFGTFPENFCPCQQRANSADILSMPMQDRTVQTELSFQHFMHTRRSVGHSDVRVDYRPQLMLFGLILMAFIVWVGLYFCL